MKIITTLAALAIVAAACGSDTPAAITDATTVTQPGQQATTALPALFQYEVELEVDYHAYTRIVGHGGIPTDYRLTYTTRNTLLAADVENFAEGVPADATVVWERNCYSAVMGPDVELLSSADGSLGLEIPATLDLVPHDFANRYPNVDWLATPATSLTTLSGAVAVVHRLPSVLSLGEEANCGEAGPRVDILNAGHAWMNAETTSTADELTSPAAALNLQRGSEDPAYIIDGDGLSSGWLIQLIDPQDIDDAGFVFTYDGGSSDELGGWELTIEGEIRLISP